MRKVLGERAVRGDIPYGEETGGGRDALDGCDQLGVVLAEYDVTSRAGGTVRGCCLIETQSAEGVRDRDQSLLRVNAITAANIRKYQGLPTKNPALT